MKFEAMDLEAGYPLADAPALRDVSLTVPDGSLYAVLGPNGSGKSTLLKVLLGVLPARRGQVVLDGRPVREWSRREMARAVGVVPQSESVAFPITARDFVAMGRYPHLGPLSARRAEDERAVDEALDACDVTTLEHRDVGTLSGGEFQRVRIARALAQEPRALVLDEPTASLDIRHEMAILERLRAWSDGGLTVVVVTHGVELAARFADRMLLLDGGTVAAEGAPADVVREDVLRAVYRWDVAVARDDRTGALRVTPLRSDGNERTGIEAS